MSKESNKVEWINNLRVFATLSVIILHVASTCLYHFTPGDNYDWWVGHIYDSFVRFSVPIFLMLTGALMLGKEQPIGQFFAKKFLRIVIPFVFWSFLYIIYNFYDSDSTMIQPEDMTTTDWIIYQLQNGSSYHLWYIYMLFSIYPIIPFINLLLKNLSKRIVEVILILWVIFIGIYSMELHVTNYLFDIKYIFGYFGYVLLGYYLFKYPINKTPAVITAIILFLVGFGTTVIGTYTTTLKAGGFDKFYYSYTTLNIICMAIGCFLIFQNLKFSQAKNKLFNVVAKHSYGVYLGHVLMLNYLLKIGLDWFFIDAIIGIPLTTIVCLVLTTIIVWVLSKIPMGKYISR